MSNELEAMSKLVTFMANKITELEAQLAASRQTTEDIACGVGIECPRCTRQKPCDCDHT